MGGEDDVAGLAAHAIGQDVEIRLVRVPALDEAELGTVHERVDEPLAIALDGQARIVRRQHDADDRLGAGGERPLDGLGDARPPVLHSDEDGRAQLALERRPLGLGRVVERRAPPDAPVTLRQLLDRTRARPACPPARRRDRRPRPPGPTGSRRP